MNRSARSLAAFFVLLSASFALGGCAGLTGGTTGNAPTSQVTVSITGSLSTRLAATAQFTAAVQNSTNQAVTWEVNGVIGGSAASGTISVTGLYTAPAALPVTPTVTVTAVSQASSMASASLTESLLNPVPAPGKITATEIGTTLNFLIDVTGSGFVSGSVIQVGGVSVATSFVSSADLQATVVVPSGTTSIAVDVTNPNPGAATSAVVSVPVAASAPISVTISGGSTTRLLATTQFTATVANSANQNVIWQVAGVTGGNSTTGTISTTGLYTGPATLPALNTVNITAISVAQASASSTIAETLQNPLPVQTSVVATQVGSSLNYLVDVVGTGFVSGSLIQIGGTSVTTTYVSATELQATVPVSSGTTSVAVDVSNPNPGASVSAFVNAKITYFVTSLTAAARLLDQATFGPTQTDITHVQTIGIGSYITEQFNTPTTRLAAIPVTPALPAVCLANNSAYPCAESEWWTAAITGPDQLRQRVAFALSEMFVVSTQSIPGQAIPSYHNALANDAFGNFLTIMKDVSLSPAMGAYLNMLNSAKPATGQIANENYARENMQLFTTGLYLLNQDGTVQVDGTGTPLPVYSQAQVQAFARAYTGWTLANVGGVAVTKFPNNSGDYDDPMVQVETYHDTTAKILLNGTTLPAGQTAAADLNGALANIFASPNVGPFVCQQLIQHLVTSTPSPAYVSRISAVFADNGAGVRGDMRAVIRAILTDTEARAGDTNASFDGGHLREPVLFITAMMRGLGFTNTDVNGSYFSLSGQSSKLNEEPYRANSVFNFFPPDYVLPQTTLNAPEFAIENTATAVLRLSLADSIVNNKIGSFTVDLSNTSALGMIAASPANLVATLNMLLMHSAMPSTMQTTIINAITPLTSNAQRVRVAIYLIVTSSQYKIIH